MTAPAISSDDKPILLDAGPLGMLAHPRPNEEIAAWLEKLLLAGIWVIIPAIADYEVRRNMLAEGMAKSLSRLELLRSALFYLPLSDEVLRNAAQLWATARKAGRLPADPKELNCDVILAAQALEVGGIIATGNVGHLALFVEAKAWQDISVPS